MRRLLLIRHAKSSWAYPHLKDHDRPINKRGEKDAYTMASFLRDQPQRVQTIFSSTAARALGFAETISGTADIPLETDPWLFTFDAQKLFERLISLPNHLSSVAVVAHNPAITVMANHLTNSNIESIPTCGIVAINCDIDQWRQLESGAPHTLDYFEHPKSIHLASV